MAAIIVDIDDTIIRSGIYPIPSAIAWVNEQAKTHTIILITGRPRSTEITTRRTLQRAGVKFNRLYMNPYSTRESAKWKKEKAAELKSQIEISMAVDNDSAARAAYSSLGIPTKSRVSLVTNKSFWNNIFRSSEYDR
jgi:predicted HAD superfamily phosphohydrolase YqeG